MKRFLPHPRYTVGLAIAWMILQERFTLADFVIGYFLGAVVAYLCRNFWAERILVKQPLGALRLAAAFAREIGVVPWTVHKWKQRFAAADESSIPAVGERREADLIEIEGAPAPGRIEIVLDAVTVRVSAGFDVDDLERVLRVVRRC